MKSTEEIAIEVCAEFRRRGINQLKAAEMLGIKPNGLSLYLTGKRAFGPSLYRLASEGHEVQPEGLTGDDLADVRHHVVHVHRFLG